MENSGARKISASERCETVTTMILKYAAECAGRAEMNEEEQAWCFMAGANSIFTSESETLLVTPNPGLKQDKKMFETLGLKAMTRKNQSYWRQRR
ncbi:hypothetical protein [Sphingobacterium haloxyli]|uniref:Biotin and thiamin synthesis-associated domain-containing protein n=1 Tax=Sphingobacterium haloxyli TaxID=2100533 RepID=A0A2S9J5D9_9SPHI|nr:hypothetical protein C5745_07555 [Sphingobacterium haloxyli]